MGQRKRDLGSLPIQVKLWEHPSSYLNLYLGRNAIRYIQRYQNSPFPEIAWLKLLLKGNGKKNHDSYRAMNWLFSCWV